jgi:hypothetical protein
VKVNRNLIITSLIVHKSTASTLEPRDTIYDSTSFTHVLCLGTTCRVRSLPPWWGAGGGERPPWGGDCDRSLKVSHWRRQIMPLFTASHWRREIMPLFTASHWRREIMPLFTATAPAPAGGGGVGTSRQLRVHYFFEI